MRKKGLHFINRKLQRSVSEPEVKETQERFANLAPLKVVKNEVDG